MLEDLSDRSRLQQVCFRLLARFAFLQNPRLPDLVQRATEQTCACFYVLLVPTQIAFGGAEFNSFFAVGSTSAPSS